VVVLAWLLVEKTAWFVVHEESVHPGLVDVMFVVFTVPQSTFSLKEIDTLLLRVIPVAPFAGTVTVTDGAVLSIVTVLPAEGVSVFPAGSEALLWMV
jgi:hypothetical protein